MTEILRRKDEMYITIFNVEHGFCALVVADNKNIILIDCGINTSTGFRPSNYLKALSYQNIQQLIISNFDEDHLSDIEKIQSQFYVEVLSRNVSISPSQLSQLKIATSGSLSPPLESMVNMHARYTGKVVTKPDFSGINLIPYWNTYPSFRDTNNLSLVTFLEYYDLSIIFPGDLERAGWRTLLGNPDFVQCLERVNVFVTSHHGRDTGYCAEVFNYCHPDIFVTSDESVKYGTQEFDYSPHALSKQLLNGDVRHVLTTRNDGIITIHKKKNDPYNVITQ